MAKKNEKMTKVQAFTIALELVNASAVEGKDEVVAKLEKELEQLAKKNSATSGKPSAKQAENLGLGEQIVAYMAQNPDEKYTVTELIKQVPDLPDVMTSQKMTTILRMEGIAERVENIKEKGKSLYRYRAPAVEEVEDEKDGG